MDYGSQARAYAIMFAITGAIIWFTEAFWPEVIPFGLSDFWTMKGSADGWLRITGMLVAWALGLNLWNTYKHRDLLPQVDASELFWEGFRLGLWAGIVEEIAYRWVFLLSSMAVLTFINFLIFGWLGFGASEWLHLNVFGVVADLVTFGALHEQLFSPLGWQVGAAMLLTNAAFRDGHKYQGWKGLLNSWFLGMILFHVMFAYGLPAAIVTHIIYDLACDVPAVIGALLAHRDPFKEPQ